jgi:hypothetical protein
VTSGNPFESLTAPFSNAASARLALRGISATEPSATPGGSRQSAVPLWRWPARRGFPLYGRRSDGRRFQIRPEDIEEVFATGAPAGERVQVDEERDRLAGAEYGSVGVAGKEGDAP